MRIRSVLAAVAVCGLVLALAPGAAGQIATTVKIYAKDNAPATPSVDNLPLKESVSQYGITWTFEKPARVGQFINGDWYVVGPVTVKMIDPKPLWGDEVKDPVERDRVKEKSTYPGQYARNGSTLNLPAVAPRCKEGHEPGAGFDSRIPGHRYDPTQFAHLPIQMKPGQSLLSTISYDELRSYDNVDNIEPIRTAAVLTCVDAPPPPDAFRPSFCETASSKIYLARNLKRELLLALPAPVPVHVPKVAELVRAFQRPWVDVADFGFTSPKENYPQGDYGQNLAATEGGGLLTLMLDLKPQEKEPLLIAMVQVGIDQWGDIRGGKSWPAWGGHFSGRKACLLFAGILLDDPDMQHPEKLYPKVQFGEDDQTAMCPFEYKGQIYQSGWTGAKAIFVGHSLEKNGGGAKGDPGWGPMDLFPPSKWPLKRPGGLPASEGYRRQNTSNSWVGEALAFRIMHAEKVWNHDAFFAYVDRWMTEDETPFIEEMKKAGAQDYTNVRAGTAGRQRYVCGSDLIKEMWQKYRNNLPPAADGHKEPPAEATWK